MDERGKGRQEPEEILGRSQQKKEENGDIEKDKEQRMEMTLQETVQGESKKQGK